MADQLAPPDTLLGLLQRGRGLGWLRAAESPSAGRQALFDCVEDDPRWDRQVEDRVSYYSTLALQLGVTASDVIAVGRAGDEIGDLPDAVALDMVKRGDDSALPNLRARLALPGGADALLFGLTELGRPEVWEGVPEVLLSSLSDDDLVSLVGDERDVPWAAWADTHPRIRAAMESAQQRASAAPKRPLLPSTAAPISELLEAGWSMPLPRRLRHRFRTELSTDEVALIRRVATGEPGYSRALAMHALAERGDPFAIPTATQVFAENTIGGDRRAAFRYIRALDASGVSLK